MIGQRRRSALPIETHSIDHIPEAARRGKAWHQAPFWFTGNFVVSTAVIGFIGPTFGLELGWAILAATLGAMTGTFFMAFHANQGPRMGLPQMIQSRAQFGIRGAIVPLLAVIFIYVGFGVFAVILCSQAIMQILPGGRIIWYPIVALLAGSAAIVGHDLLHHLLRWLTYLVVPIFGIVTIVSVFTLHPVLPTGSSASTTSLFLVQFAASAGYQISYAVYVSDYSRYLPRETSTRSVISWTYLGAVLSSVWLMSLGAFIASSVPVADIIPNIREIGDHWFGGFGIFAIVILTVPSGIAILGVNAYGAMLSGISILEAFRPVRATKRIRIVSIGLYTVTVLFICSIIPENYIGSLNTFVLVLLYLLAPWTAINLVDFYFIRRGKYAITEMYKLNGIYGRWGIKALLSYFLGTLAMVPFMTTTFYVGNIAEWLDGADISLFVGLIVSGVAYYFAERRFDPSSESDAILESERSLREFENSKMRHAKGLLPNSQ